MRQRARLRRPDGLLRRRLARLAALALIAALSALAAFVTSAHAATCTWTGNGADNLWTTSANWDACVPTGGTDIAIFDGSGDVNSDKSVTINADVGIATISVLSTYSGTITQPTFFDADTNILVNVTTFTMAGGTFVGGDDTITISGALNLSAGSFTSTSGILAMTNTTSGVTTWSHTGGIFTHNSGTVTLQGNASTIDVPAAGETFFNLTINPGTLGAAKTITTGDQITVNGLLNLSEGLLAQGGAAPAGGSVRLRGNVTVASTADGGTASVVIDGTTDQTLTGNSSTGAGGGLPQITINKASGNLILAGTNIRTNTNWTYTAGTIDTTTNNTTVGFNGGTITGTHTLDNVLFNTNAAKNIAAGTTLTVNDVTFASNAVNGASASLVVRGDIAVTNTNVTGGSVPVTLSNGATQTFSSTITPTGTTSLPAITIAKSGGAVNINNTIQTRNPWTFTSCTGCPAFGGTGTLQFSPAASLTVTGSHTLNNVTLDSGTTSIASDTTLTTTGTLTLTNGMLNGTGTLAAEGNVTQANTFDGGAGNLRMSGSGSPTFNGSGVSASGSADLPNVVIDKSGGTLLLSGILKTHNGWNQTSSAGTVNAGTSTLAVEGATFTGNPVLNILDIRAASTVSSGTTTAGTLEFNTGDLTVTGSAVMKVTGTVTGATTARHVVGNLRKDVGTGTPSVTYEVGDGTVYAPVTLAFASVTTAGEVTASSTAGDHAEIATSGIDSTQSVNRHWTLASTGTVFTTYSATFNFAAGDVDPDATTSIFRVSRYNGSTWALQTAGTQGATATQATGIAAMGDFQAGEPETTPPLSDLTIVEGVNPGAQFFNETTDRFFYKPTAGSTFTIRDTATDPGSGVATVAFPAISGDATFACTAKTDTAPGDVSADVYSSNECTFSETNAAAPADTTVIVTDNAGNTTNDTIAFALDNTAPPGGGALTVNSTAATGPGSLSYSSSTSVTINSRTDWTEAASDTASGLATSELLRDQTSLTDGVCGAGFSSQVTVSGTDAQTLTTDTCYRYRLVGTDNVGNESVVTTFVAVDTTAPAAPGLTLTETGSDPDSHVNGNRIFIRTNAGSTGGSFDIAATASDAESGILMVSFPPVTGTTGGSTDDGDSPYATASPYAWTTSSTSQTASVNAINKANVGTATDFDITVDNTAPSGGGEIVVNGGLEYDNDASFVIDTRNPFTEAASASASGISANSSTLVRERATLTGTTCGGTWSDAETITDTPVQNGAAGISGGNCYRYTHTGADNVGNVATTSATVKVDTSAPGTTITGGPADGSTTGSTEATFTFTSDEGGTFQCKRDAESFATCTTPKSYAGLSHGSHTFQVRAVDPAGNPDATPSTRTWSVDSTPPSLVSATADGTTLVLNYNETLDGADPATGAFTVTKNGSPVTVTAADASGTNVTLTLGSPALFGDDVKLSYAAAAAGPNPIQDVVGNDAGNLTNESVTVGDATPPDTTITGGPAGGSTTNSTNASFTFTATEAGTFECSLDSALFATCSSGVSYSSLANGSHTFQVRARDNAGNPDGSPASVTWTVDTVAPTATIDSGPSGSTTATSADFSFSSESGATFECRIDGGAFGSCTSPKSYSGLAVGSHTFEVRATDAAGNTGAAASRTWTITSGPAPDTTPPTTTIDSGPSGSTTATDATFTFSANESSTFECKLDGGTFAACSSPKSYTGLAAGSHTFEVRGTDGAGNTGTAASRTWTITAPVSGDNAPELASSSPGDGVTVSSISSITLTASEPVTWSAVSVTHENGTVTPLAGSGTSTTSITRPFGPSSEGLHTVRATLSDGVNAGVAVTSHFTVWVGSPGEDAPPSEMNAGGDESSEMTASNGAASVEMPAGATSDSVILKIDPSPTTSAGTGFTVGSDTVEVTARLQSDGTPVTRFAKPIDVEFPNAPANAIPQRSQDGGAFSPIMLVFSHELPDDRDDAYFRDASGTIHILTRHLTFFALYRDVQVPTAPRSLVGVVASDGLTLRWEPASDNSEITGYVLLVDGTVVQVYGSQTYEAKLGLFTAGDTRTFAIQARDATGLLGPATSGVRGVPSLVGLSLEQATATLASRGFSLGAVSNGPGAAGTVAAQSPAAPGPAPVGSSVNVTVGDSSGQAKLVLKVASAKRISLAERRWIGVRVTVSARSTIAGELVSSSGRVVQRYAARAVPSGASTLRFTIPQAKIKAADRYRLHLRATASGQSVARTARVQIVPGVLKARFTPARRPIGVAIVDGSIKGLDLGSSFRVNYVEPSLAFDVVGLQPAFIEAAVIDVTVVPKGFIRSLRQVFPELQIVALAPTSATAAQARVEGASIALVKPVPASRIAALLRRTLGR